MSTSTYETSAPQITAPHPSSAEAHATDESTRLKRLDEAMGIVDTHSKLAIGAGIIPVPVLDMAAITLVLLRMLKQLSEKYQRPFTDNGGRKIIGAVLGGYGIWGAGSVVMRVTPGLNFFSALAVPGVSYLITKSLGKLFVRHFEVGGTVFDINQDKLRTEVRAAVAAKYGSVTK